mmetsp:Transcript_6441/g.14045  ORF Transcript_6441/g.14045 Transcript_6441/m.14045 type:complete len:206 (-) Transcript_6441:805-1422(-)
MTMFFKVPKEEHSSRVSSRMSLYSVSSSRSCAVSICLRETMEVGGCAAMVGAATGAGAAAAGACVATFCNCSSPDMNFARISSQFPWGVSGPVYLLGLPTLNCAPKYGILFKFNAFAASSFERNSTNANFPETRHAKMGLPGIWVNPTCSNARPKKSLSIDSVISGVVFPTNNSRLIFSSGLPPVFSGTGIIPGGSGWPVSCCHV